MASISSPSFTAGGLASGLDTNTIVDKLVQLAQQPITLLQTQQGGMKAQVSTLGDIASKLSALQDAAKALGTGGVVGVKATSTNTAFSVDPGSSAVAGSYAVTVDHLAVAAKALSGGFAADETVRGGSLFVTVDGTDYATDYWKDGASLDEVAAAIRGSGAPVSAVVLNDGTKSWLSVTKRDTGHPLDLDAADALTFTENTTGVLGKAVGLAVTQQARNAEFHIDGVDFTRSSNVVTDALPGTTLGLKTAGGPEETLSLANDVDATQAKLQTYVDAYNAVINVVQKQLSPDKSTDRGSTLAGDAAMRSLQQALQRIGSTTVGDGTIRSLADVGVKTGRDGSLSIDKTTLAAALSRDPGAVNDVFARADTGLADVVGGIVDTYVDPTEGVLVSNQSQLQSAIHRIDDDVAKQQARLDAYRSSLIAQFAAMESVVSQMKSIGTFLTQQSAASSSK